MNRTDLPGEVAVIVPAAGSGSRLGGHRKQFRELGGRPVIVQTLLVFERHPEIHHIVVAAPEDAVRPLKQEFRRVGITKLERVVPGGDSRQKSVQAAMDALPPLVEVVLVHDAVRPFVRLSQISAVIAAVRKHGAASPALPVTDTLRRVDGGFFTDTVDRTELARMQTPQGFRREVLTRAHDLAVEQENQATDDVGLVRELDVAVRCVSGSYDNVKITTPEDWDRALDFWPLWETVLRMEDAERSVVGGSQSGG